jgi:hypothetical protein
MVGDSAGREGVWAATDAIVQAKKIPAQREAAVVLKRTLHAFSLADAICRLGASVYSIKSELIIRFANQSDS